MLLYQPLCFCECRNEEKPSKNLSGDCRGGFVGFARLFSQQYQIYATVFWGRGKEFQGDNILTIKGSLGVDKPLVKNRIRSIRQLPIGKLTAADMNAFGRIGFIHHIQLFPFCRIQFVDNSSFFVRFQALVAIEERHSKFKSGIYSLWKAYQESLQAF